MVPSMRTSSISRRMASHGHIVGLVCVAEAHRARRSDGGLFDYAKKFKAKCAFHVDS